VLLQVGDSFVLNVLDETNYSSVMKHFLKRFAPGECMWMEAALVTVCVCVCVNNNQAIQAAN